MQSAIRGRFRYQGSGSPIRTKNVLFGVPVPVEASSRIRLATPIGNVFVAEKALWVLERRKHAFQVLQTGDERHTIGVSRAST